MFDAYVRIRLDDLTGIEPWHLQSGADDDLADASRAGVVTAVSGFTEWAADAPRTLSMGWDWSFDTESRQLIAHWHTLRTNIMIVDADGGDLGREQTQRCIAERMARVNWETTTAGVLGLPWPLRH